MSSLFLSVGQCGNQLSKTLIDFLKSNQTNQSSYLFNHYDGKFRFINLDSEIKVINSLLSEHKSSLRSENVINTKCGRGSNWASGYTGLAKDGSLKIIELSLEAIRRESERCDFLLNFVMMHSLSGGTGSGCGSKLIEQLRDEYGWKKLIFTQSVAPFRDGELPLQHYNNLLCLSHLHEYADFIGLYQNDDVLNTLEKSANSDHSESKTSLLNSKTGLLPFNSAKLVKNLPGIDSPSSVSLNEMNSYIIKCLLNTISPVDSVSLRCQSIGMELYEMQRFLCPNANLKIVEFYNLSSSSVSNLNSSTKSNSLLKKLLSSIPKYKKDCQNERQFTSLSSLIIARGDQDPNEYNNQLDSIKKSLNPVVWNPFTIDFWSSKAAFNEPLSSKTTIRTNSLAVCTNRNKCVEYLREVLEKSKSKYSAKAYLHWYEKFNVGEDQFESSFYNLNLIIDSYDQMTN